MSMTLWHFYFFFFKQKMAYEMRISDWSSDVCSSDLPQDAAGAEDAGAVDGGVEPAEELLRRGDVGDHAVLVGDVGPEVAGVGLAQRGDGRRALLVVDVEQRGLAAVGDDARGHGQIGRAHV